MTQQQAERYFYISQLTWEAETKNTKAAPKSDLGRSSPLRAQVGKANSTAAAAGAGDGDGDDGGSRRQANKKISKKRQRQVSELCE